ncbi:MAG: ERG2 family protein [Rivularia sp. (in: cyanobacteria)]
MPYIFNPDTLHTITKKSLDLPCEQMFETLRTELEQQYPGKISNKIEWMLNNAGGCMYSIAVLHASFQEYLLIFGSSIGTAGHTGRHFTEIYDFVIDGELWYFSEKRPYERVSRKAGDKYYLDKFQSEGLSIPERAWVLEYARGFIPSMLPFGLADSFFSTLDWKTIASTFGIYGKLLLKNYWNSFVSKSVSSTPKEIQ